MMKFTRRLAYVFTRGACGEEGASFTEYGLLLIVVVLAVGVGASILSTDIVLFLNNLGTKIIGWVAPAQP